MSAPVDFTSVQAQPTKPSSRRALLGAGLGALAATVAGALGRAAPVRAANGDTVTVGGDFTGTNVTKITNTTWLGTAFWGEGSSGTGVRGTSDRTSGVSGYSYDGVGVSGGSTRWIGVAGSGSLAGVQGSGGFVGVSGTSESGTGVFGTSSAEDKPAIIARSYGGSTGLLGVSGTGSVPAAKAKTGVYGQATQDSTSKGVWGRANGGRGVLGEASSGSGVYGQATSGYAIRGNGRLRFDKVSGVATIAAGNTAVTISPGVDVTAASFVLLTPKANIGSRALWFTTDPAGDKFTIRISSSLGPNTAIAIAWLLVN